MTEEFIIEAADNGMTVRAEDYFEVFENSHIDINSTSKGKGNVYYQLGKLLHTTLEDAMNEMMENKVKLTINIEKG